MTSTITYTEGNSTSIVYKIIKDGIVHLLVKKDGKPYKVHRFIKQSGRMLKPAEY